MEKRKKKKLSPVTTFHYVRLVYRAALLVVGIVIYVLNRLYNGNSVEHMLERLPVIAIIIWIVFVVEMILRFFPSKLESPGCQKQFANNYQKTGNTKIEIQDNNAVILVALVWIAFNAVFGILKMQGILDDSIMLLLCCFYSVCDMICILFFCPFQVWFLKNKCCSTCRIYNWDYAMMFTPLFFVKGWYALSLFVLSLVLLARWEITVFRYPERFAESTNKYLGCANCSEKLCHHKKQLISFRKSVEEFSKERIKKLKL